MRIDIEKYQDLLRQLEELNLLKFEEIEFHQDGEPIRLSDEQRTVWEVGGMNNSDFIGMKFWDFPVAHFNYHTVESWRNRRDEDPKRLYNPEFGDERICDCGHTYERHFDGYEDNREVGCKYCHCYTWREPGTPDPCPEYAY